MTTEKIQVTIDPDLEDLIPGFLENRRKDVDKMKEALTAGDAEALRSVGHSLKGVGGGYGFDRISELGAEIEVFAKAGDLESIKSRVDDFADYLEHVEVVYE
jgi:HPt (histidine-containing phosphotransfer) domain-containing protein